MANTNYRYGFNGKENDNEVKVEGNQQDYGMRIYDPRLGRFLSEDPITKEYPELTPYQFSSNSPIFGIDRDGLELFGNNWLFDIWLEWKFGDPTGIKTLKEGVSKKVAIQTNQMSYHNSSVPESVQNTMDHYNNIDANVKIASGTAQLTKFNVQTSFDVFSSIVPLEKGGVLFVHGLQELNRSKFAMKFYSKAGFSKNAAIDAIRGIDLTGKVFETTLKKGTKVEQWLKVNRSTGELIPGNYYTMEGADPTKLGISLENRIKVTSVLNEDTKFLQSTTSDIMDTWTVPGKTIEAKDGGVQFFHTKVNATPIKE